MTTSSDHCTCDIVAVTSTEDDAKRIVDASRHELRYYKRDGATWIVYDPQDGDSSPCCRCGYKPNPEKVYTSDSPIKEPARNMFKGERYFYQSGGGKRGRG